MEKTGDGKIVSHKTGEVLGNVKGGIITPTKGFFRPSNPEGPDKSPASNRVHRETPTMTNARAQKAA